jgi:hypothetical protein
MSMADTSVSVLTPLVLPVCLFDARHRLLHDIVLGTVVINNPVRAAALRRVGVWPAPGLAFGEPKDGSAECGIGFPDCGGGAPSSGPRPRVI